MPASQRRFALSTSLLYTVPFLPLRFISVSTPPLRYGSPPRSKKRRFFMPRFHTKTSFLFLCETLLRHEKGPTKKTTPPFFFFGAHQTFPQIPGQNHVIWEHAWHIMVPIIFLTPFLDQLSIFLFTSSQPQPSCSQPTPLQTPSPPPPPFTMQDPAEMSAREMRAEITALGGTTQGCLERADIVERLLAARRAPQPRPEESAPSSPATPAPATSSSSSSSSSSNSSAPRNPALQKELQRILKTRNLYEILAVPTDASDDTIARAYKKLALKFHPDKCKEPGGEDAFKKISHAYETLKNGRQRYDQFGDDNGQVGSGGGRSGHVSPEDIFAEMFGNGFQFNNAGPGNVYMSFGPGGFQRAGGGNRGNRRRRGGGQDQEGHPLQGGGGGFNLVSALGLFMLVMMILPVILPLLTTLLPMFFLFSVASSLRR